MTLDIQRCFRFVRKGFTWSNLKNCLIQIINDFWRKLLQMDFKIGLFWYLDVENYFALNSVIQAGSEKHLHNWINDEVRRH